MKTMEGAQGSGKPTPALPLDSFSLDDPIFFNLPRDMLSQVHSSECFNPFLDLSIPMNDGLNGEGLDFLQRCL